MPITIRTSSPRNNATSIASMLSATLIALTSGERVIMIVGACEAEFGGFGKLIGSRKYKRW